VIRARLDADEPVAPDQRVGVLHLTGIRKRRGRCGDDAGKHTHVHRVHDDPHLVGGGRHGGVVEATRVGVERARHAQRSRRGIHACNEPSDGSRIPAGEHDGDVVRRRQQQRLKRLQLRQPLARRNRNHRLRLPAPAVGIGNVCVAEHDRRAALADVERVIAQHEIRSHHLRDARDGDRMLVRACV
jgi:hypothetical protein